MSFERATRGGPSATVGRIGERPAGLSAWGPTVWFFGSGYVARSVPDDGATLRTLLLTSDRLPGVFDSPAAYLQ